MFCNQQLSFLFIYLVIRKYSASFSISNPSYVVEFLNDFSKYSHSTKATSECINNWHKTRTRVNNNMGENNVYFLFCSFTYKVSYEMYLLEVWPCVLEHYLRANIIMRQNTIQFTQKKNKKIHNTNLRTNWNLSQRQKYHVESWKHSVTLLTCLATFHAVARKAWWSNHIIGITSAFSKGSPSLTVFVLIIAIPSISHHLVKWVHMNPFCCWPFLTFNYRASCM